MAVEFKEEDFLTVEEKKGRGLWPTEHNSVKGLWPYVKRLGENLVGIEIGTSCAESTHLWLDKCPNIKKLYTIDPYKQFDDWVGTITQEVLERQRNIAIDNLKQFGKKVEMLRTTSDEAAKKFKPESIDFIFIDGDHSYEGVLKDCKTYYPFLKKDGFFCGHDYGFLPDVKRGVDEFRKEFAIKEPLNPTLNTSFFWYKK